MPTFARVRRERGPALAWTPTEDSYYELAQRLRSEGRLPLHLTQMAILEFEAHLRESSVPLPFGLLAGDVCVCPQTRLEYLLVDTVSHARVQLGEYDPYAQLAEELQSLASEQSRKRKVAIGWYLGGLADDLTLDDDVTHLHQQLFPERFQLVLVRGAASGAERGAFLRYESIWSRWFSIPFFELLGAGQKKGEPRTAIRWKNYRADEPARQLGEAEVSVPGVNVAPRPSWGARLFGASLEPLRRAERGTPERVVERAGATSLPARQEPPSVPRSQTVTPPIAPPSTLTTPSSRTNPPEIAPTSFGALEPSPVRPVERKPMAPVEPRVTVPVVAPTVASPADTRVAREVAGPEVQNVFIDGMLVPAPLVSQPSQEPGMVAGSDRARMSSVAKGALLLLTLISLCLVAA